MSPPAVPSRPLTRIPQSAYRRGLCDGAQLLHRIDDRKHGAFRLVGKWFKPGRLISESELWPSADWPALPILLEITPSPMSKGKPGGSKVDYILWRYRAGNWEELAALRGRDAGAWLELDPLIERVLYNSRIGISDPDVSAAAERTMVVLDQELSELNHTFRERLLTILYEEVMKRGCAEQQDWVAA